MTDPDVKYWALQRERREHQYKQHLDRLTLRITLASTIIALLAAAAAFWSGWEAHEVRINDERPIIDVNFIAPQDTNPPLPTVLKNRFTSAGKSAARNIRVACESLVETTPPVSWSSKTPPTDTFPYLIQGHWTTAKCSSAPGYNPPINSQIVDIGVVEYEDAYKNHYVTPFCWTWTLTPDQPLDLHLCAGPRNLPEIK